MGWPVSALSVGDVWEGRRGCTAASRSERVASSASAGTYVIFQAP